jgi:pyrroloquinoline quinone biosynthesis protein B
VDGIAGLLVLRERQPLRVFAPDPILAVLAANTVFGVLDPALVERTKLVPSEPVDCGFGLRLTLLPMPGKVPLYLEDRGAALPQAGPTYAAKIEANGRSVVFAPACAEITGEVRAQLRAADAVFFDGTLFTDDEMIAAGVGATTGRRMGHVSMSGPDGSLALLADLPGRRIFLHINNTNPVLLEGSPERQQAEDAGFEIAYDGMELCL